MKIAIFHDYFDTIGGAEKLVLTLARELKADIVTTDYNQASLNNMGFKDVKIISLGKTTKRPIFRQISTCSRFENCNLTSDYDFFIFSGNWSIFAAKKHKPNMFYCHSPVRSFYDLYDSMFKHSPIQRIIFVLWVKFHKKRYENSVNHVRFIITNSKNTKSIIKNCFKKDSEIIYPPINTANYYFQNHENFWLSVNRIYPEKRIELQIDSFKSLPEENLIIVGSYSPSDYFSKYAKNITSKLPKNVQLLDSVSEKKLSELYSKCKGFISTAKDEDFGMTVVEAMASGKPVVCVKEGGFLETVIDCKTGILVESNTSQIINAIKSISKNPEKYKDACISQAKKFDISLFLNSMNEVIQKIYSSEKRN
jgi:glycosyltransferase involved in cell wall biosynthesis